jgi:hypothetical protein
MGSSELYEGDKSQRKYWEQTHFQKCCQSSSARGKIEKYLKKSTYPCQLLKLLIVRSTFSGTNLDDAADSTDRLWSCIVLLKNINKFKKLIKRIQLTDFY